MDRRSFLKKVALAVGATAIPIDALAQIITLDPNRNLTDAYAQEVASSLSIEDLRNAYSLMMTPPFRPNTMVMSQSVYERLGGRLDALSRRDEE